MRAGGGKEFPKSEKQFREIGKRVMTIIEKPIRACRWRIDFRQECPQRLFEPSRIWKVAMIENNMAWALVDVAYVE